MALIRRQVSLKRDVVVTRVPSGERATLPAGTTVVIVDQLGGNYVVKSLEGETLRVEGKDGDAVGERVVELAPPPSAADAAAAAATADEKAIWDQLRQVYDPEIPVNVVDLGLIYEMKLAPHAEGGSRAAIKMTLTAPGCGMGEVLKRDVETRVRALPGVREATVEVVFDPPWDRSRMSEDARLALGFF